MADIRAFYGELKRFYFDKEPEASNFEPVREWRVFDAIGVFSHDMHSLRMLLEFASCDYGVDLINSDELLVRAVKQIDAAIEEISAVRDIAVKYLPVDAGAAFGESEYMYNTKGEKVYASNSGDADDPFRRNMMRKFTRME